MEKQEGSNSNWEGMLKRWILAHSESDGTTAHSESDGTTTTHRPAPKWRGNAHKLFLAQEPPIEDYDIDDLVYDIVGSLIGPQDRLELVFTLAQIEELLDELQAYAEEKIIDVAKVLHSDRRLLPLFRLLSNARASIRVKAAQVITTIVQNSPTSQQVQDVITKGDCLLHLLHNLNFDPDATSRTKVLGTIFAIIRNNKPGISEFRKADGYAALRAALSSESVTLQRDALNLIQYLLHENSSDCNIVTELGLPGIMMELASSDDAEVREAAHRGLLVLPRDVEGAKEGPPSAATPVQSN